MLSVSVFTSATVGLVTLTIKCVHLFNRPYIENLCYDKDNYHIINIIYSSDGLVSLSYNTFHTYVQ